MTKPGNSSGPDWGAGRYERTAENLLPAARVLVAAAAPRPGEQVLDVGAGTGNAALLAAEAGAEVTAVDPSRRLLGVAEATAQERGLALRCAVGDAAALPADDASVDCLLSSFGVIFAPDADAAVQEIARVLRPGGRAALTAWIPGGAVGAVAVAVLDKVRTTVGGPPPGPRFLWHDEGEVREAFRRHGMSVEAPTVHELAFTAASPAAYLDAELANHPMAVQAFAVLRQHGQDAQARAELLQLLEDRNEDPAGFRSTSRYVTLVAHKP